LLKAKSPFDYHLLEYYRKGTAYFLRGAFWCPSTQGYEYVFGAIAAGWWGPVLEYMMGTIVLWSEITCLTISKYEYNFNLPLNQAVTACREGVEY